VVGIKGGQVIRTIDRGIMVVLESLGCSQDCLWPVFLAVMLSLFFDFAHLVGTAIVSRGIILALGTAHLGFMFYVLASGKWNIIQPTYPIPCTTTPCCISTPSMHAGLHSCTGIVIRSSQSGGMS
jgi:hypothetical protein